MTLVLLMFELRLFKKHPLVFLLALLRHSSYRVDLPPTRIL